MKKQKRGFLNLAKKTMAVISGSISALIGAEAHSTEIITLPTPEHSTIEVSFKKELKPQFTLRLNSNSEKSMLFMHRSHSSHSSHRSHSSHSSHSSHYSSSSTYTPPPPVRTTTPASTSSTPSSQSTPSTTKATSSATKSTLSTAKRSNSIKSNIKSKSSYHGTSELPLRTVELMEFYYRELAKGSEGYDVEYLQQLLVAAGYITPITGYFGDKTEAAVIKFQKESELKPDGKVKERTFTILKDKVDEL